MDNYFIYIIMYNIPHFCFEIFLFYNTSFNHKQYYKKTESHCSRSRSIPGYFVWVNWQERAPDDVGVWGHSPPG